MLKREAEEMIGSQALLWMPHEGLYLGELLEVETSAKDGRHWRGVARIDFVISPAQHCHRGETARRGHRRGETIHVGPSSIQCFEGVNVGPARPEYLDVLVSSREYHIRKLEEDPVRRHGWFHGKTILAFQAAIEAERQRLANADTPWSIRSMAEMQRRLELERADAADRAYVDYSFGQYAVEDADGWTYDAGPHSETRSRTVYLRSDEESDTFRVTLTVRFRPYTSEVAEAYALTASGNRLGKLSK